MMMVQLLVAKLSRFHNYIIDSQIFSHMKELHMKHGTKSQMLDHWGILSLWWIMLL